MRLNQCHICGREGRVHNGLCERCLEDEILESQGIKEVIKEAKEDENSY